MDLAGARTEPQRAFETSPLWGGYWTVGDEWHIGLTDPGEVDWDGTCQMIRDPLLVVHDVPHSLTELEIWDNLIATRMDETASVGLTIVNGQYVLEVQAQRIEDAADATRGIPLTAWIYGGPTPSDGRSP